MAVAAGLASLRLTREPGFYDTLGARTTELVDGLVTAARRHSLSFSAQSLGGMFGLYFSEQCPDSFASVTKGNTGPSTASFTRCSKPGITSRHPRSKPALCRWRTAPRILRRPWPETDAVFAAMQA